MKKLISVILGLFLFSAPAFCSYWNYGTLWTSREICYGNHTVEGVSKSVGGYVFGDNTKQISAVPILKAGTNIYFTDSGLTREITAIGTSSAYAGGSVAQVQFNNVALAGDAGLTYEASTDTLYGVKGKFSTIEAEIIGNVIGNVAGNITGNITGITITATNAAITNLSVTGIATVAGFAGLTANNNFVGTSTFEGNIYPYKQFGNKYIIVNSNTNTAIQSAIDALDNSIGGTVILPVGDYPITTTISLKDNVSIYGQGKSTKLLAGTIGNPHSVFHIPNGVNNVSISDLTIYATGECGITGSTNSPYTGNINIYIKNVEINETEIYGISANTASKWTIDRCKFNNVKYPISLDNATENCVTNNRIKNIGIGMIGGISGYGMIYLYCPSAIRNGNNVSDNIIAYTGTGEVNGIVVASSYEANNILSNNYISISSESSSALIGIRNWTHSASINGNNCHVSNLGAGEGYGIVSNGSYCNVSANNCRTSKTAASISGTGTVVDGTNINN